MCNPNFILVLAYCTNSGILLAGYLPNSRVRIQLINLYVPYNGCQAFWNNFAESMILSIPYLILSGDLYLSLGQSEVWGHRAIVDPLSGFFRDIFSSFYLIDVVLGSLSPTWWNGHIGEAEISKRLDKYLIISSLLGFLRGLKSSIIPILLSDHQPIILSWKGLEKMDSLTLCFDSTWLKNLVLFGMVTEV